MNSHIGIVLSATGQASVIEAIQKIHRELKALQAGLTKTEGMMNLGAGLERSAAAADKFASAVTRAAGAAGGIQALAQALNAAAAATERLGQASGRVMATPVGGPGMTALPPGGQAPQQIPSGAGGPVAMVPAGKNAQRGNYYNPAQNRWYSQSGSTQGMAYGATKGRPALPPGHDPNTINMSQTGPNSWTAPPIVTGGRRKSVFDQPAGRTGRYQSHFPYSRMATAYLGYRAFSEAGQAIKSTATGQYLGGQRDDVNEGMTGLISIDMDKRERDIVETAGQQYISKNPNTSMQQYLGASAQAGSAISKDILGVGGNIGITEAGLTLSVLGKMQPDRSVDLITDRILAEKNRMSPAEQQKNFAPGSDYLKRRPQELLGLYNAMIREAKTWGPDIAEFQKSALAVEQKLGWTPERSLAHLTLMRNQGFRSSTTGMAMKSFSSEQGRQLARLQMLNERDKSGNYVYDPLDVTKAKYKQEMFDRMEENARRQQQDPYYMAQQYFEQAEQAKQRVSSPLDVVGANKHHISQYEAMIQQGYLPELKRYESIYETERRGGSSKANQQMKTIADEATSQFVKLQKAMDLAGQAAAKFSGNIGLVGKAIESLSSYGKHYQGKATVDSSIAELEKQDPRGQKIKDPVRRRATIAQHLKDMEAAGVSKEQQYQYLRMTEEKNWETPLKPSEFGPGGKLLGRAVQGAASHRGLVETWNEDPFKDGRGPLLSRPRYPMSDSDRMDLELSAAKGEPMPTDFQSGDIREGGSNIKEGASEFRSAITEFRSAVGQINSNRPPGPLPTSDSKNPGGASGPTISR